jgi:hypothetical protein
MSAFDPLAEEPHWVAWPRDGRHQDGAALITAGMRLGLPLVEGRKTVESGLAQGARR